jgi:type VI secretion system protein ImpE
VPLTAKELFTAGKVRDAEKLLTAHLRERPSDKAARTFLFELLCFAGDYTRAEKQLAVLAGGDTDAETGAIVYYAALHAEKTRHELFEKQSFPAHAPPSPSGTLNGKGFTDLRDADPDIGARLEVYAAGS